MNAPTLPTQRERRPVRSSLPSRHVSRTSRGSVSAAGACSSRGRPDVLSAPKAVSAVTCSRWRMASSSDAESDAEDAGGSNWSDMALFPPHDEETRGCTASDERSLAVQYSKRRENCQLLPGV